MIEKNRSTVLLDDRAGELHCKFSNIVYSEYDYEKNCIRDSELLGIRTKIKSKSVKEIIDNIKFEGDSLEIIKLYNTYEHFDANTRTFNQIEPTEEQIQECIDTIKADLILVLLSESLEYLFNQFKLKKNKVINVKKEDNFDDIHTIVEPLSTYSDVFTDLYVRNYTNLNTVKFKKFIELEHVEFDLLEKIPLITSARYFKTIRENYDKYLSSGENSNIKCKMNYSRGLEYVKSINMPHENTNNYKIFTNELAEYHKLLNTLKHIDSNELELNKSLSLYLINKDNRIADIVFLSHLKNVGLPLPQNAEKIAIYRMWNIMNSVDSNYGLEIIQSDMYRDIYSSLEEIIDEENYSINRINIGKHDLFCTEMTLLQMEAENSRASYYRDKRLLHDVLFQILKAYTLKEIRSQLENYEHKNIHCAIFEQLKCEEPLLNTIDYLIEFIDVIMKHDLENYYKIRGIMYNKNFVRKYRACLEDEVEYEE